MNDIVCYIDNIINSCYGGKQYGLAELIQDKSDIYPATVSDRKKIFINDKDIFMTYHRILSAPGEEDEAFLFGRSYPTRVNANMRMVIIVDQGEDAAFDVANKIPEYVELDGFKFVNIPGSINIITDHNSIYQQEWGNTLPRQDQLKFNLFAIEYNVEFIKCSVCHG